MPRASTPCPGTAAHPCHAIVPRRTKGGRCDVCRREVSRQAGRRRRAQGDYWYDSDDWRRTRAELLRKRPICEYCERARSTVADHVPPRRILEAACIHQLDHPRWLTASCASCHSQITRAIDDKLLLRLRNGEDAEALAQAAIDMRNELVAELRAG